MCFQINWSRFKQPEAGGMEQCDVLMGHVPSSLALGEIIYLLQDLLCLQMHLLGFSNQSLGSPADFVVPLYHFRDAQKNHEIACSYLYSVENTYNTIIKALTTPTASHSALLHENHENKISHFLHVRILGYLLKIAFFCHFFILPFFWHYSFCQNSIRMAIWYKNATLTLS